MAIDRENLAVLVEFAQAYLDTNSDEGVMEADDTSRLQKALDVGNKALEPQPPQWDD